MFCDDCDRGNDSYCLDPPLSEIPEGPHCCKICSKKRAKRVNHIVDTDDDEAVLQSSAKATSFNEKPKVEGDSNKLKNLFATFGNQLTPALASTKKCAPTQSDRLFYAEVKREAQKMSATHTVKKKRQEPPNIQSIVMGSHTMKTWYTAPFPEEYFNKEGTLYLCEFCLKYMRSNLTLERHLAKCQCKSPPGDEIYRDGKLSIFEVNGRNSKV